MLRRCLQKVPPSTRALTHANSHAREQVYRVRDKEVRVEVSKRSLSGTRVPKVALPSFQDDGEILRWLCKYACHTLRW